MLPVTNEVEISLRRMDICYVYNIMLNKKKTHQSESACREVNRQLNVENKNV